MDVSPIMVSTINSGRTHFEEADLDGLVHKVVSNGMFRASPEPVGGDVFLIAVPTPSRADSRPQN
ncbi:UDP-glucose/GDP-mannose dehydrogenase family, NAD binding domain [Bauldia litoralis]|uniref:UDP-glucose/GDP-mannose dehydrogenase family, NAD binding domain n=2 Tax=Bauldia litoralis TaxID=665467 RepID=A0A1G6CVJ7_9HYPH|nr:UDP-glucose/GDP-mannose dehydrogenase family, NAD binding domain [Bauldia litoralis]